MPFSVTAKNGKISWHLCSKNWLSPNLLACVITWNKMLKGDLIWFFHFCSFPKKIWRIYWKDKKFLFLIIWRRLLFLEVRKKLSIVLRFETIWLCPLPASMSSIFSVFILDFIVLISNSMKQSKRLFGLTNAINEDILFRNYVLQRKSNCFRKSLISKNKEIFWLIFEFWNKMLKRKLQQTE